VDPFVAFVVSPADRYLVWVHWVFVGYFVDGDPHVWFDFDLVTNTQTHRVAHLGSAVPEVWNGVGDLGEVFCELVIRIF